MSVQYNENRKRFWKNFFVYLIWFAFFTLFFASFGIGFGTNNVVAAAIIGILGVLGMIIEPIIVSYLNAKKKDLEACKKSKKKF